MYDVILEMGITGIVVGNSFDRYRRKLVIVFYERFLFDDLIVVGNGRIIAKYLIQRIVEVGEFTCQRTDDQIGGEAVRTLL